MTDPFERAVQRERYEHRARVASHLRAAFQIHLAVYLAVNAMLVVVWALTWTGHPWFVYPLLGWGIGLVAHGAHTRFHLAEERRLAARLGSDPLADAP